MIRFYQLTTVDFLAHEAHFAAIHAEATGGNLLAVHHSLDGTQKLVKCFSEAVCCPEDLTPLAVLTNEEAKALLQTAAWLDISPPSRGA
jgi:hypothetical protein